MKLEKNQMFVTKGKKYYAVAGYWDKDIVLAPLGTDVDQVLIYTESEMAQFLADGTLKRFNR